MRPFNLACHLALTYRLAALLAGLLFTVVAIADAREVRVGVYENPPKIMAGPDGQPSGIFGDLLTEIARQEGWTIHPVPCKWEACLAALQAGRIDLLPDVARTAAREKQFDFHAEPALQSWSALYVPSTDRVNSMLDFRGRRIAVLKGSVQESYLRQLFAGFGIDVTLVPVMSFDEGFALVEQGRADAAAVNYNYGEFNARRYDLMASSIMFLPSRLFFAAPHGTNADLLAAIDRHLADWQVSEGSPYYKVLARWMAQPSPIAWPAWWRWAAGGILAVVLIVVAMNRMLRRQVRAQTARLETDLVQLRHADEALSRQHGIFRSLIRTIPDLVWLKDENGVYLACNDRFEKLYGAAEQDIVGRTDYDFVDRELADFFRAHDRAAMAAGKPSTNEEWLSFASDGYRGLFETTKTPMLDADGRLIGVLGIAHDITERMKTEAALRESEARLQAMYEGAPEGILLADVGSRHFVDANPTMCAMLGYTRDELLNLGVDQIHPASELSRVIEIFQRYVRKELLTAQEVPLMRKDGSVFPVDVSVGHLEFDGRQYMAGFFRDITDRKRAEETIAHLAYHDQLTTLPNRALFLDRLGQALAACRRQKRYGAVMFVDLDQFKRINDVHGHTIGDSVLKDVAQRLRHYLRQDDTVARFGGDEFVILLPELSSEQEPAATLALSVAEKIRAALEQPIRIDGQDYLATASIGVSLFPKQGETVDDLIREADIAMYRAKDSGRNALMFFEHTMQEHIAERYALERDLRDAVKNGALALFLQSQVNAGGDVIGAEALVRWQHPTRGLVAPAAFIPLAEETGLIIPIGEWVLRETCRLLVRLNESGLSLRLAVNVSPRQFRQANFVTRVREILSETGADPLYLTLEITENLLVEQASEVVSRMLELSDLGIRFAIDDFGTGYSSLAYLKRLPLNELKIDKSFVQDVPYDLNDVALVETILAMARHLRFEVLAEGVETRSQLEFLTAHGCRLFQGYHFHRPQPAEDWLAQVNRPIAQADR
jgi:diguanylate cyclase (GGDEF)-like protein/PAS domain S-box-containing protein